MKYLSAFIVVLLSTLVPACGIIDDAAPAGPVRQASIDLRFAGIGAPFGAMQQGGIVDSIVVDSAIIVLSNIRFKDHSSPELPDDTTADAREADGDDDVLAVGYEDGKEEGNTRFRGPFVVVVRDTLLISLEPEELPPGTYTTVKFHIRRLKPWDPHTTVDNTGMHPGGIKRCFSSTGTSIVVWGSILKDGLWQNFEFGFDGQFQVKRYIAIATTEPLQTVPLVLNVDAREWFVDPRSGQLLDPFELSKQTQRAFRDAICISFFSARIGDHYADSDFDD